MRVASRVALNPVARTFLLGAPATPALPLPGALRGAFTKRDTVLAEIALTLGTRE